MTELVKQLKQAACAVIRDSAVRNGRVSAEIEDANGFHELTVLADGTLLFAVFLGDRVPVDGNFENLPWNTLSALLANCVPQE